MKNLPESLQTFRSFYDFQIFINRNEGEWHMPFEWHKPLEIFYVRSGRGKYYIEDKVYIFEPGDLFVIGNQELHRSQLIDNEAFEVLVLMFDPQLTTFFNLDDGFNPLSIFYERSDNFSHQLKCSGPLDCKLRMCFDLMMEEYAREDGFSLRIVGSLLQWLLVELNRAYANNKRYNGVESWHGIRFKEVTKQAMDYINVHYHEDIHLKPIAEHLCVNPSYLSREFKRNTGFTVMEFISFKRIWKAKELLLHTDTRVTEIAFQVGYNNVTHFHWTFKKLIGVSPNKYRKLPKYYYNLKKH
ncbi:AraC family transcriptional regulator [Paenibacillus alkalitolerans]|uniref:AraC family transcriptional regulator n=1 Tax=Paenibacillus alkalitolerans TaxID=2799335 RepID=UPI002D7F40D7|nr:AraC family transcriptional regulator [Paenibacillus alkalitolerans]